MKRALRSRCPATALVAVAALGVAAHAQVSTTDPSTWPVGGSGISYGAPVRTAQTTSPIRRYAAGPSVRDDSYSLLPYTRRGYFGINIGCPGFKTACGIGAYACDDPNAGVSLYTGGLFNHWLGMELGYTNTGEADRAGGRTSAQGVNVSLLLRAPMGAFNVFAKGGAIYGQTRVSTGLLSDLAAGKRRGWGASYGAGVGYDFTPSSGVVLEWSRHQFRFPGNDGREDVDSTSLGYVHRF